MKIGDRCSTKGKCCHRVSGVIKKIYSPTSNVDEDARKFYSRFYPDWEKKQLISIQLDVKQVCFRQGDVDEIFYNVTDHICVPEDEITVHYF